MNIKKLALLNIAICAIITLQAQPSASYYTAETLDGKSGRALEMALGAIINPHTRISYDNLWGHFPVTDPGPADSIPAGSKYTDLVYDMYAWMQLRPHFYSDGDHSQTTGINREHAVPNSWWGAKAGQIYAYSDLHHLMPADGKANNKKSDSPLGSGANIPGATFVCTEGSGAKYWTIPQSERANYGNAPALWEPTDEYKGDFARMYLYVVCAYENHINWENNYMFESSDSVTTIKPWAKELLLQWHRQDGISDKERARNNAVEGIQHNRNPFVDYPELVEYIWGDKSTQEFSLANAVSAYSDEYINGTSPDTPDTPDTPDAKSAEIYFPFIVYMGEAFEPPTLKTNSDGAITYSSSDTSVAEVDEATGAITIKGVGRAKITAAQAETDHYASATATYLIEVRPAR